MQERKHAFVTGATGFLGSHLTNRLLNDGYRVTTLARSSRTMPARNRVLEVLSCDGGLDRLNVVEGDITLPNLGMSEDVYRTTVGTIDATWHCAASLSFAEEERDEIFRMNVDGARHVLEFAQRTPSKRLHHVSTAYVAGIQETGLESEIDNGQKFRNPYEASKCQAELLVRKTQLQGTIVSTVYRPSVVIGDSRTGRATHFHGVYAFIRGLWSMVERKRKKDPGKSTMQLELRVPGTLEGTLNFVPIDYVVDSMMEIGRRDESIGHTYHLANPVATPNRVWLTTICKLMNMEPLRFVSPESFIAMPPNRLETLFRKHMAFYYMYLQGEPRFDCTQTLQMLAGTGIRCPEVNEAFINKMIGWYVNFLNQTASETAAS